MIAMFKSLLQFRVKIEYTYYQHFDNVDFFEWGWCAKEVLVIVNDDGSLVFN